MIEKFINNIASFLGINVETAAIVAILLIVLHLLTHEIPIIILCGISFFKLLKLKVRRNNNE